MKREPLLRFDPNELVIIGLDTEDGPEHELWDERIKLPLEEATVQNIMALGVKETVTLRKGQGGKYEVVDGRRRVMHAREANKRLKKLGDPLIRVPALVEVGDELHMERLTVSLNEIRKDDDTLTKAEKCMRLLHRNGNDYKDAALVFGVSVAAVKNWVKVGGLPPRIKRAVASGEISASAAAELHGLDRQSQISKLEKLIGEAKAGGRKKATLARVKSATGKKRTPSKRLLQKLVRDKALSNELTSDMLSGLKLALGEWLPPETTKIGALLKRAGYRYE